MKKQLVAVMDFGGQYSHLIVRRCRNLAVYAELIPHTTTPEAIKDMNPSAIILSGGPSSVYADNAPVCDPETFDIGIPILGICYGAQLIARATGGDVKHTETREYGKTELLVDDKSDLFSGTSEKTTVWMSHGDLIGSLPADYDIIAHTAGSPVAAFRKERIYGIQFHPEVVHTIEGEKILKNFLFSICGCEPNWSSESFINSAINEIKATVGSSRVILGLSGGIDSATVAVLLHRAIGDELTCIYVDNGLMRKNETEEIIHTFKDNFKINLEVVNAQNRFLERLRGISDPEEKRKVIGDEFIRVFDEAAARIGNVDFLAQGTIYPDRVESAATSDLASRIKSHHNVGALPDNMKLRLIEPIRDLYKDEVRTVAKKLDLPATIVKRHPFPGPGLAARIIGEVTPDKLRICRDSGATVEEELKKWGLYNKTWQAFAMVGDDLATGVLGDERSLGHIVTIRAVESAEAMTADFAKLPYDLLEKISSRITNEISGVTWVTYAISSKPPSTIEPC
ncbi:MAG: glutamine-hydrolyzing GMP synthase [Methanosarcinales archaeon]|nr:MAG: glutamine-hydrolyzing GMP synthase [Methanosarcinales archaeon]